MEIKPKLSQDRETKKWTAYYKNENGDVFKFSSFSVGLAIEGWYKKYKHLLVDKGG